MDEEIPGITGFLGNFWVLGSRDSEILVFGVLEFWDPGILGFGDFGILGSLGSAVLGFWDSGIPKLGSMGQTLGKKMGPNAREKEQNWENGPKRGIMEQNLG